MAIVAASTAASSLNRSGRINSTAVEPGDGARMKRTIGATNAARSGHDA